MQRRSITKENGGEIEMKEVIIHDDEKAQSGTQPPNSAIKGESADAKAAE